MRAAAGREVLRLTDSVGFDAYAAGWLHDRPTGTWRYLLSTPMLTGQGPRWVYERLLRVFKHAPLPKGVSPVDIVVIDPDLELALFGAVTTADGHQPLFADTVGMLTVDHETCIDGFAVTDGFMTFDRRLAAADRACKRSPARVFDHKVRMLDAA